MKITVTPNEIRLRQLFYTVVIPKNSNITYTFYDRRRDIGVGFMLMLDSDSIKIESWSGIIGKTIYRISPFMAYWFRPHLGFTDGQSRRKAIGGVKRIKSFLDTLKANGYDVAIALDKFNTLNNLPSQQFTLTDDSSPKEKLAFLKYSSVGIICFVLFIVLSAKLTSTPLSDFYPLGFIVSVFLLGFLYIAISYLFAVFKNRS